jgi:hypothetical protein
VGHHDRLDHVADGDPLDGHGLARGQDLVGGGAQPVVRVDSDAELVEQVGDAGGRGGDRAGLPVRDDSQSLGHAQGQREPAAPDPGRARRRQPGVLGAEAGGRESLLDSQLGGPVGALGAGGVGDGQLAGVAHHDGLAVGDGLVHRRGDEVAAADLEVGRSQHVGDLAAEDADLLCPSVDLEGHGPVEHRPAGDPGDEQGEHRSLGGGDESVGTRHGADHGGKGGERHKRTAC